MNVIYDLLNYIIIFMMKYLLNIKNIVSKIFVIQIFFLTFFEYFSIKIYNTIEKQFF